MWLARGPERAGEALRCSAAAISQAPRCSLSLSPGASAPRAWSQSTGGDPSAVTGVTGACSSPAGSWALLPSGQGGGGGSATGCVFSPGGPKALPPGSPRARLGGAAAAGTRGWPRADRGGPVGETEARSGAAPVPGPHGAGPPRAPRPVPASSPPRRPQPAEPPPVQPPLAGAGGGVERPRPCLSFPRGAARLPGPWS